MERSKNKRVINYNREKTCKRPLSSYHQIPLAEQVVFIDQQSTDSKEKYPPPPPPPKKKKNV